MHAYIHVKVAITVPNTAAAATPVNNKKAIFKNCVPFTSCISKITNTQIDDAQDIDIVMPMHNLVEYSDAYSKTSGSLWQYCGDEPALDNNNNINFPATGNSSILFKVKQQVTGQTENGGTKDVEIMVPLKYLSNFLKYLSKF